MSPFRKRPVDSVSVVAWVLMQFFKPENDFTVRESLIEAGRANLIGGCEGPIPTNPPKEAIETCRKPILRAAITPTRSPTQLVEEAP